LGTNVGDEGGFAPPLKTPEEALDLILEAANNLGYQNKIKIILDIAASQFYSEGRYKMKVGIFNQEEMFRYYDNLIQKYPISGLEDPFSEDDLDSWQKFTKKFDKKILIIGDDLLATNSQRIKKAGEKSACSAMILKLNQIGTITEAIAAAKLAKDYGWKIIVSHRSGETCDDFISDFAVGIGADFIKSGAPARGERTAKYNRLLRIEEG
jgi:enolase